MVLVLWVLLLDKGRTKPILRKRKLTNLKQTLRTKMLETCIEEYINLRRVTNLELTLL